jgi:hypothetical protein
MNVLRRPIKLPIRSVEPAFFNLHNAGFDSPSKLIKSEMRAVVGAMLCYTFQRTFPEARQARKEPR